MGRECILLKLCFGSSPSSWTCLAFAFPEYFLILFLFSFKTVTPCLKGREKGTKSRQKKAIYVFKSLSGGHYTTIMWAVVGAK
jgi:hypothetical protein